MIVRTEEDCIAYAGWKTIYTGKLFDRYPAWQQQAILAHEEGHICGNHAQWRLLCLLFCPFLFIYVARIQEYLADRYAVNMGHGPALYQFLRPEKNGGWLHPSHATRRAYLRKPRTAPVKGLLAWLGVTDRKGARK